MAESDAFSVGEILVFSGRGVFRVKGLRQLHEDAFVEAEGLDDGMRVMLPLAYAQQTLRPLVARRDAERIVEQLKQQSGPGDRRPFMERRHEVMLAVDRRPLATQVTLLHSLYRTPFAWRSDSYAPANDAVGAERRLIITLEGPLVSELSRVLGKPLDELRDDLRAAHPAFALNAPEQNATAALIKPAAPVAIAGHDYLGTFAAPSGKITIGEPTAPVEKTITVHGLAGRWHAYFEEKLDATRSWEIHGAVVLVHDSTLPQYKELLKQSSELKRVDVTGSTMSMVSAEARDTESFLDAAYFATRPVIELGATGGGCVIDATKDDVASVRGTKIAENYALLIVEL